MQLSLTGPLSQLGPLPPQHKPIITLYLSLITLLNTLILNVIICSISICIHTWKAGLGLCLEQALEYLSK